MQRFELKAEVPLGLMRPGSSRTSVSLPTLTESEDEIEEEPLYVNDSVNRVDVVSSRENSVNSVDVASPQANGVNGVEVVSPQANGVNEVEVVSPRANCANEVDVVSPQANGINGVDVVSPRANSVKGEDVVSPQANGVNGVDAVSPRANSVNGEDVVSPQANDVNKVDAVSPQANGENGIEVLGCVGVSPLEESVNEEEDVSAHTNVENDMDVSEHVDTENGMDGLSPVSGVDMTDEPQYLVNDGNVVDVSADANTENGVDVSPHVKSVSMEDQGHVNDSNRVEENSPHGNVKNGMDPSPTKSDVSVVEPPRAKNVNAGELFPHVNVVNGTDTSRHVNSVSWSDVSPQVSDVSRRVDVSHRPKVANGRNDVSPINAVTTQHAALGVNGMHAYAPHVTVAKGMDISFPRPSKPIPALLTSFEKEFIGESVKENVRKQRQKERDLLSVSEEKREQQQRSIDSLHRSLDMDKVREYFDWQRMMQDRFLYRNAEIRRSNSMKINMIGEEKKKPKRRFRQVDTQPLCPRLLSMDYPAGVRIRLRKKLEVERIEMRRLNPPDSERDRPYQPGKEDKRSSNAKEVLGELPQQKSVEKWDPRSGGFPRRPAVSPASSEDGDENRRHGILSRHSKVSKGHRTIVWSDKEPRGRKTSSNLKRSLVHSAKGQGRQKVVQSPDNFPDPRRTMSASEPVRPKIDGVLEKDLRLPPARNPRASNPVGHLLPHDHARRDSGVERKFIADLIREAKQEAKDNPNIRTRPLVIYLP